MEANSKQISDFLEIMFSDAVSGGEHFCLWTLDDGRSKFFDTISPAVDYARKRSTSTDVYSGVGMFKSPPKKGRGTASEVSCITSMWCDIDVDYDGTKKKELPKSLDEAIELAYSANTAPPSMIVESGYGIHPYWLLDKPHTFDKENDRKDASDFAWRWGCTVQGWAKNQGYTIDSVGDLSRVLRVGGTMNYKNKKSPKKVELRIPSNQIKRYSMKELESVMIAPEYVLPNMRQFIPELDHFILDASSEPPSRKLRALIASNRRFDDSLNRRRVDMADQSASSYDMSLATMAAEAGWSDQEIVNLLISHRREHRDDLKLRVDYYQRTIGKARTSMQSSIALAQIEDDTTLPPPGVSSRTSPDLKKKIIALISKALGINIKRWVKQGKESANFSLILDDGTEVFIGNATAVLSQSFFRSRIYDSTNLVIRKLSNDQWHKICERLGSVVEVIENMESSRKATIIEWLRAYLPTQIIYRDEEWTHALLGNFPFVRSGKLHVHVGSLKKFLRIETGENIDKARIWDHLRLVGFECGTVSARIDDKVVRRSYWSAGESVIEGFEHG